MKAIQVTVLLQVLCALMVAAQVDQSVTLPSSWILPSAGTTGPRELPSGYVAFPEFGFAYKLSIGQLNYNRAREMCIEENAQLAVTDSTDKVAKILNQFDFRAAWVGLGRGTYYQPNEWITIDGKLTENLPWVDGEPSGEHRCAALRKSENGLINYSCGNYYNYLCEIALPKN